MFRWRERTKVRGSSIVRRGNAYATIRSWEGNPALGKSAVSKITQIGKSGGNATGVGYRAGARKTMHGNRAPRVRG